MSHRPKPLALYVLTAAFVLHGAVWTAGRAQLRLLDESDRAAFRAWFVLLADAQFYDARPDVTDCAALVRAAYREALRPHTPEWRRQAGVSFAPAFADVRRRPPTLGEMWPLFRITTDISAPLAEFADARTLIRFNTRALGRGLDALAPGDLLYFHQERQSQPDHLMVFVGSSHFEPESRDWIVYHTGPDQAGGQGEVRKVRLADLLHHPSPLWRPMPANQAFVGIYRLAVAE